MKKTVLSIVSFLFLFCFSHAQLRVAIVAGAHQSSVNEENDQPNWDEIKNKYSGRTGFHLGFIADLPFSINSPLVLQPGVVFHNKGRKFAEQFDPATNTMISQKNNQYINYVDLPVNIVYKFGSKTKFIIGGGPYVSFFYNGKETSQTTTQSGVTEDENNDLAIGKKADQYRILNFGINGLAGFEFGRAFITANYSRGLNDFYETLNYNGSFKHQVIGGTIGIFLGKPVNQEIKIKDSDNDGVPDDIDNCPDEPGPAITKGCPDKDADGIADKNDKCPDVKGTVSNQGCPVTDRDGDGINDNEDKCPDIAGSKKYNGCPVPDSDKDGINDEEDKCPEVAGYARYGGCPIPDTDADGINDEEDKCPLEKGTKENNGCPVKEIKKDVVEKINYAAKQIQFEHAKAVLLPASLKVLDNIVILLNENPGTKLLIEGHTSLDGDYNRNMTLSENRADAVKQYLLSKGIIESRLTSKGQGPNQPLNDEKTVLEKSQNRRVELRLSN